MRSYAVIGAVVLFAGALMAAAPMPPATSPSSQPAAPTLSGKLGDPIVLFNGKDIDDWTYISAPARGGGAGFKKEDVWTVKDGALHLAGGKGTGYLRISKEYTNFVLTVEQRHIAKGNGGVLFGITGEDKVWPRTVQVQGQSNDVGDFINQGNFKMTTDPARTTVRAADTLIKKLGPVAEKPMGQWDTVVLTVNGPTIWVTVNGVFENIATGVEPLPGKIGLQNEGVEMEFRKIELREIESPAK